MNKKYRVLKYLKPSIIVTMFSIFSGDVFAERLNIEGDHYMPMFITPEKSTGLAGVIVVYDIEKVTIKYKTKTPEALKISYFSNLGAAYNSPLESINYDGEYVVIDHPLGDVGYIFESDDLIEYYWVVDYSKHRYSPHSLEIYYPTECEETSLIFSGEASAINYYSINGRKETLSRDLELSYNTLEFDEESKQFVEIEYKKNIAAINESISIIPAITCQSVFNLKGDRFLSYWNQEMSTETSLLTPVATIVKTEAITENSTDGTVDSSNQITSNTDGLGGSAPATISFLSYISDAVIHCEWQMANDESFEDILYRFNQQDLTYTFTSEGTTFVRFIGSNSDGSCESYSETYTVEIGSSELQIPNAFSPNGDGINDEWKVSYRSIIDFKCWIFDRQGNELFYFTDPNIGWNGKSKGKSVPSGVYYYVINATGSDGKKYKKSGDINIIKSKGQFSSSDQ